MLGQLSEHEALQVSAAGKRPANAERRQDAKDKIPQQVVEAKPAKKDKKSSMDAKKALQSIALGGFPPQQAADVLKLAGLCGKVCIPPVPYASYYALHILRQLLGVDSYIQPLPYPFPSQKLSHSLDSAFSSTEA